MNIFVLDRDPMQSASMLCDKHVVKMALETAQILCTITNELGGASPYKSTHKNHPCVKWAMECQENFWWTYVHGLEICNQYYYRYGRIHKCRDVIVECYDTIHLLPRNGEMTPFALAMPDKYKSSNATISYRRYYANEKAHILKYTNCTTPNFQPYVQP